MLVKMKCTKCKCFVLQNSGMPLFNGVGGPYTTTGYGSGTDLQGMWSAHVEAPNSEEVHKAGVS